LSILPSDLSPGGVTPYRGYVDSLHGTHGVRGWVVNLAMPGTPPTLALRVGRQTVARTTADRARNDIAGALGQSVTPGFFFAAEALRLAASRAATPSDLITICIDGTDFELDSAFAPMYVGDLHIASPAPGAADTAPADPRPPPGAECAIDRLLVIPGFGCMMEGWVLSPQQPVVDFRLRLGGAAFTARPDATYRKARPDLLSAFPRAEYLIANAGFVALLTSDAKPAGAGTPIVQLVYADGSTASIELPPTLPRLLGHTATAAEALRFFPSLAAESFFGQFADAVVAAERARRTAPVAVSLNPSRHAFIHVLPDERSDLFLTFEFIAAACRENLVDGLTLIAATNTTRAAAPWHLRDLLASHQIPASLLTLPDTRQSFAALPDILRVTGVKRFAYVDASLFLPLAAYRRAAEYLRGAARQPLFLGLCPDSFANPADDDVPTSRCFAWTTQGFSRWAETAPTFLGGHYRDNLLCHTATAANFHRRCVHASVPRADSAIEHAVNSSIYATAHG
jgi:hypothetical protein